MSFINRYRRSIANKFLKKLKNQFRAQNAKRFLIKDAKTSLSMFQGKNAKNSPKQCAHKTLWMWRRKYRKRFAFKSHEKCATTYLESLSRMSQRKSERRFAPVPRLTVMVTLAPIRNRFCNGIKEDIYWYHKKLRFFAQ